MQTQLSPLSPDLWLKDLFASKAVQQGGVIRRKTRDIERCAGMDVRRFNRSTGAIDWA